LLRVERPPVASGGVIAVSRRVRVPLCGLVLVVACAASAGCAKSDGASGKPGAKVNIPASQFKDHTGKTAVQVEAVDNDFDDAFIRVSKGTKVTWTNDGRNDHSVTPVHDGSFIGVATTGFNPGESHSATFINPGDYPYYGSIHGTTTLNGQAGVVRVVAKS
jgi:plastocyanin